MINIEGRKVGQDHPPLVIAELGINHGGSLEVALEMVDAAARSGVEVLKHQTHIVEDEMIPRAKEVKPGNSERSIYEIMKSCALTESEEFELKRYVESKGMIFLSTPFSRAAAQRLFKFKVKALKIGSGECNNLPLLKHVSEAKVPLIVSTGMNSMESVRRTVSLLESLKVKFALMHTTNLYPTPTNLVRLGAMQEMMKEFPGIPIGLSDHTTTNTACIGAMAIGADLVERHFTDHMNREGPDIVCSMDENTCSELVRASQDIFKMRGGSKYELLDEEQVTRDFAYASVVTIKPIQKGEVFTLDNLWVKRPGDGEFMASDFEKILGKRSNRNLMGGVQLKKVDITNEI
jgi:sialic acid synthase SpsE